MNLGKVPARVQRGIRHSCPVVRVGQDGYANYSRLFSETAFIEEVISCFKAKSSMIALTYNEFVTEKIVEAAEGEFGSVFYVLSNHLKCKVIQSETISCPVLSISDFFVNVQHVPDGSCIIFDNLWMITHHVLGSMFEQALMLLPLKCTIVLVSRPFANINVFCTWLTNIRRNQFQIIEAPLEKTPASYMVLNQAPRELKLIKNSSLTLDYLSLIECMKVAQNDFPSKASINWAIDTLLEQGHGPVLVIVPCEYFLDEERMCLHAKSDFSETLEKFMNDDTSVLYVTTKVAESIYIPTHSVIITSFAKYNGTECREMLPSEFYHLTRSAGRPGIDTNGFIVTSLMPQLSLSNIYNVLITDVPTLYSRFTLDFKAFMACQYCRISDMDEFTNRSFNGFCQKQVVPMLREQLSHMTTSLSDSSVCEVCQKMAQLEISISTICTHPLNIRKLLTDGRVVKIRSGLAEHPWGVCYGPSMCGTVTVAIKGLQNRPGNSDQCLITLPVSDVVAVSSTVKSIPRKMIQDEFDQLPFVIESDYPLYNGNELTIGAERLHALHSELAELAKKLDPSVADRWRECADTMLKSSHIRAKIDIMGRDLGIGSWRKITTVLMSTQTQNTDGFLLLLQKLSMEKGLIMKGILERFCYDIWTPLQSALTVVFFTDASITEHGITITDDVNEVWTEMSHIDTFPQAKRIEMAVVRRWLVQSLPGNWQNWRVACIVRKAMMLFRKMETIATEFGWAPLAEKMKEIVTLITASPNFGEYFIGKDFV